jgi:hypothetical protein
VSVGLDVCQPGEWNEREMPDILGGMRARMQQGLPVAS